MQMLYSILATLAAYLIGSLSFAVIVSRTMGLKDPRTFGSKNPGATNVRRVLGAGPGNLVFGLDALKGAVAAGWAILSYTGGAVVFNLEDLGLSGGGRIVGSQWTELGVAGLIGALLGHSFSCFTRFRGGKGVATSVGGLLILMPLAVLIAAVTWAVVFYSSRYVSLSSIASSIVLVFAALMLRLPVLLLGLAIAIAVFVVLRHLTNIKRLLNGTENKFVRKTPSTKS